MHNDRFTVAQHKSVIEFVTGVYSVGNEMKEREFK